MNRFTRKFALDVAVVVLLGLVASFTIAADAKQDAKPGAAADRAEAKLPPGWTEEDMKAFAAAATPGKMQALLVGEAGTWEGKNTSWPAPDAPSMTSDVKSTIKPLMDGRYTQVEVHGEMPGMGPYHGLGLYGFDNVSQKFVCTWLDSFSTGMMNGTGELSPDGKQIVWKYTYNCPITKKPAVMRQHESIGGGGGTKTLEMWGADPKSGKDFQMMRIEMTRK
jgi:hypothetical protein